MRAVKTPLPPRPCAEYSRTRVRLANPPSVATSRSTSSVSEPATTTSMDSSSSPPAKRMPMTPVVAVEADRHRLAADEKQVVVTGHQRGRNELVAVTQVDGNDTTGAVGVEL